MKLLLTIGAGSFIGGVSRYLLSLFIQTKHNHAIPWETLAINVIGCFIIGVVFGFADSGNLSHEWRLFLATGILGGFTTFSAFSHETFGLMRDGQYSYALIYVLGSVVLGLLATFIGYLLTKLV